MIDIILPFIESEEMREYLRSELSEVSLYQAINVITASRASLEDKGSALRRVADEIEAVKDTLDEDDVNILYCLIRAADFSLNEITENIPAGTIFLLTVYFIGKWQFSIPFMSFESACQYLLKVKEEDDFHSEEYDEFVVCEIEKWVPVSGGELQLRVSWTLSHEGVIWFTNINYKADSYLEELSAEARGLESYLRSNQEIAWLPIPFKVGDIVTVDCQPERGAFHAVITDIGDNRDCCAVQAVYMTEDGEMKIGALKHDFFYTPIFTCLLRIKKFEGEINEANEAPLQKASEMLKQDPSLGLLDEEEFFGRMGFKKSLKGHGLRKGFVPDHTEVND